MVLDGAIYILLLNWSAGRVMVSTFDVIARRGQCGGLNALSETVPAVRVVVQL